MTTGLGAILRLVGELRDEVDPLLWEHTRKPNILAVSQLTFGAAEVLAAKQAAVRLHNVVRDMDAVFKELMSGDLDEEQIMARFEEQETAEIKAMQGTKLAGFPA